jgi:hypothetical protein
VVEEGERDCRPLPDFDISCEDDDGWILSCGEDDGWVSVMMVDDDEGDGWEWLAGEI